MEITKRMVISMVGKGNERLVKSGHMDEVINMVYNKVKNKEAKNDKEVRSIIKTALEDGLKEDKPMNLKELIEMKFIEGKGKGHGVGICKNTSNYKSCVSLVLKAEGLDPKTPIFKLSPAQRKKLDAAWVSAEGK